MSRRGFLLMVLVTLAFLAPQCRRDVSKTAEAETASPGESAAEAGVQQTDGRHRAIESFLSKWDHLAYRDAYSHDKERTALVDTFVNQARGNGFKGRDFEPFAWGGARTERGIATLLFWRLDPEGCASSARKVSAKGDFSGDGTLQAFVLLHAAASLEAAFREGLDLLGRKPKKARNVGHRLCVMASLQTIPPDPFAPREGPGGGSSAPTLQAWKDVAPPSNPTAVVKGFLRRTHQRFVEGKPPPRSFLTEFVLDGLTQLGRGENPRTLFQGTPGTDVETLVNKIVPADLTLDEYKAFFRMDMLIA